MRLKAKTNYCVSEADLTRLGISREKEVIFLNGDVTYHYDGALHTATFDDQLDDRPPLIEQILRSRPIVKWPNAW